MTLGKRKSQNRSKRDVMNQNTAAGCKASRKFGNHNSGSDMREFKYLTCRSSSATRLLVAREHLVDSNSGKSRTASSSASRFSLSRCLCSVWIWFGILAVCAGMASCGLEQPILNNAVELGPDWVPDKPDPYLVRGQVYGLPGASVMFYSPTGSLLTDFITSADQSGLFSTQFPGSTEYRNIVIVAQSGSAVLLGLAVRIPKNKDIYQNVQAYHIGKTNTAQWQDQKPVMANLDDRTTAITLTILRKAYTQGTNLGSVGVSSMNDSIAKLAAAIEDGHPDADQVVNQIRRLIAGSMANRSTAPMFKFPDPTGVFLNSSFLEQIGIDYDGDLYPDLTPDSFVTALDRLGELITLSACKSGKKIRVVFMVDMRPGQKDLNCNTINRFKTARDEEGKIMFITGGMEVDVPETMTPKCQGKKDKYCLEQAEWTQVNAELGNWKPNTVPMRDDGQEGDAVAGDGIWTKVFEFPYIPPDESPTGIGVRIGYKYTWGFPKLGWTGTEEWPGNHRILELYDLNGDGIVVRYDYFGDETSNKNQANLNQHLCGSSTNPWPEHAKTGCFFDVWENRIDTNGDCIPDTYPSPGPVSPVCEQEQLFPVTDLSKAYVISDSPPQISGITPATGKNSGGFLVSLSGLNFDYDLSLEVNTADSFEVSGNAVSGFFVPDPTRLYFLAPPFPAQSANVVLIYTEQILDESGELVSKVSSVKRPLEYTVDTVVPCSLYFPAVIGQQGWVAVAGKPSPVIAARLMMVDAEDEVIFDSSFRVELGLSPPCCNQEDECPANYSPCYQLPDPRYQPGWQFFPATVEPSCPVPTTAGDEIQPELQPCAENEYEFLGTVVPEYAKARYKYVVRYTFDYGASWDYCDLPKQTGKFGNEDGFSMKNAGILIVK